MTRGWATTAVALVLLGCVGCSGSSHGAGPSQSPSAGRSVSSAPVPRGPAGSLPARWWTWEESIPVDRNPVRDTTGADCGLDQPTDVWFLAGTFGGSVTRTCTIPAGRPVYFPVLNTICTLPQGQTVGEEINECTQPADRANAEIDGTDLPPVAATSRGAFRLAVRPGSAIGVAAGTHEVVATGEWVGPLKLTAGTHIISFEGVSGTFETQVEYRLTVTTSAGAAA